MSVVHYKSKTEQKKYVQAVLAAVVPLLILAFILAFYGIRYDTNDDATLANLSAGAYGTGLHTVHLNIILSAIMRPLYAVAGDTNWYVITQLLLTSLSVTAVFYIFMKKLGTVQGLILAMALFVPFAGNVFYAFQYSKTSSFMLTGGLLLVADNLEKFNKFTLMGIILSVFGSMTRWESFFAVGGIYAALLLVRFFGLDKKGKWNAVFTMVAFFAVILGAEITDVMIYRSDAGWDEYVKYNAARTEYSDYKVYLLNGENIFREEGVNDTEFAMLYNWDFYDEERFTTELLNNLSSKVPDKTIRQTVLDTAYTFKTLLYGNSFKYAFALVLICGILFVRKDPRYLSFVGTVAIFGCLLLFLLYRGRFTRWVQCGLLWAVTTVMLTSLINMRPDIFRKQAVLIAAFAFMCIISVPEYISLNTESDYWKQTRIETASLYDRISEDKENLYLISVDSLDSIAGYDVWRPRGDDYFSNIVVLGGWLSRTPYRDRVLEKYKACRPMVDSVDNPNVYLDGTHIHIIAEYASQQIGVPVYYVETGSFKVAPYQLVTVKPE